MVTLTVFVTALVSTVFCKAINAYTLQVAYPLWRQVGADAFAAMHREYLRRLWPVITLPHVVMFFSSAALLWRRPTFMAGSEAYQVFCLDAGVVAISAFAAGPIHERFARHGRTDDPGYRRLIFISAVRVVLMLAASGVLLTVLVRALRALHG